MSFSNESFGKCQKCVKSSGSIIHGKCNFCQDLEFQEGVLCDLNRRIQDPAAFKCYAFRRILKLAGLPSQKLPTLSNNLRDRSQQSRFQKLLDSNKIKYQRAMAQQKLGREQDGVFMELKYHFAWNVMYRKPVFARPANMFDFISDTFSNCSELIGAFVSLLWLAPDHLHLYVESDGGNSIETIVQEMKPLSAAAILAQFPDLKASLDAESDLWDKAYFVETIA